MDANRVFDPISPHELPITLDPLIGRERQVGAICHLLRSVETRLLTLTGPGGVGKTRLAFQAAHELQPDFGHGVRLVELAAIEQPDQVLPTIARAVDVGDGEAPLLERLQRKLWGQHVLLLLDNFEHQLEVAPLVIDLLAVCPGLAILATSRAPLNVSGERLLPVSPLDLPPPAASITAADLDAYAATRLFVARATAVDPNLPLADDDARAIGDICRRLDGLPLAIELAAARVLALPPRALLAHLEPRLPLLVGGPRDAPARLRTMRNAIDWSYDLLSPEEQALFRRLSVFVGGFSLAAADRLIHGRAAGAGYPLDAGVEPKVHWWLHVGRDLEDLTGRTVDTPPLAALDLDPFAGIESLVKQSLVRQAPPVVADGQSEARFAMLETIREFGRERLTAEGEETAVRAAHAAWALAFGEELREDLWNHDQRVWADKLDAELPNLRAALDWAASRGAAEAELALRLPVALWLGWQFRGRVAEGRAWLNRALSLAAGPAWDRAGAMNVAGMFAWIQHEPEPAAPLLNDALAFWRPTGNNWGIAQALTGLALVAWTRGDIGAMVAHAEEARERYGAWGGKQGEGICLVMLAIIVHKSGDLPRARAKLDQALTLFRDANFGWGIAMSLLYAGEGARDQRDLPAAAALFAEALDLYVDQGDPWGIGVAIASLATLCPTPAEADRAARLFGAAEALRDQAGAFLPVADPSAFDRYVAAVHVALGPAAFAAALAAGRDLTPEVVIADARHRRDRDRHDAHRASQQHARSLTNAGVDRRLPRPPHQAEPRRAARVRAPRARPRRQRDRDRDLAQLTYRRNPRSEYPPQTQAQPARCRRRVQGRHTGIRRRPAGGRGRPALRRDSLTTGVFSRSSRFAAHFA